MAARTIRYRVGNEHSPTDPWGRSELVIHPDGTARLDHFFSRPARPAPSRPGPAGPTGSWTGRVDPAALETLWSELARAGFPNVPPSQPRPPDSTIRTLAVETDGGSSECAYLNWHQTPPLPGYAQAFDVIDGVIRQLSQDTVKYPTKQHRIVDDIEACPPGN